MIRDLRIACRTLARRPSFAAVIVITLALGIGANTAIFSVVDAVVLRALPFTDADRLAAVFETVHRDTVERRTFSYPDFEATTQGVPAFESMAAYSVGVFRYRGQERAERLRGQRVTPEYFSVLRAEPILGRSLSLASNDGGGTREVVLSHDLWQRHLGGSQQAVGRQLELDGEPYTIVGIMPAGFSGVQEGQDLWVSMLDLGPEALADRGDRRYDVVARLAAGASLEQANQQLTSVFAGLAAEHPRSNSSYSAAAVSLHEDLLGDLRRPVLLLLVAVGLLLLIACANVANMLLVHAMRSRRQSAICVALGARPKDLLRRSLMESIVLGLVGGSLGILLAAWGLAILVRLSPVRLPAHAAIELNPRVLMFALSLAILTGAALGLAAAWRSAAGAVAPWLREGSRGSASTGRGLRRALLTAEVALALLVSIAAGLMIQSWRQLNRVDPGFASREAAVFRMTVPGEAERRHATQQQVLGTLRALPGVEAATLASDVPLEGGYSAIVVSAEGAVRQDDDAYGGGHRTYFHYVAGDYFQTLGIPIVAGRAFDSRDQNLDSPATAVISRRLAERLWPDQDPLGKRIKSGVPPRPGSDQEIEWTTIVGVVGEVRHRTLVADAGRMAEDPDIYVPLGSEPLTTVSAIVRTTGDAGARLPELRRAIEGLSAEMPVYGFATLGDYLGEQTARDRFSSTLMGLFAALSLLLAAIGIYGVVTYQVDERTREIGIRMALGAARVRVVREVVVEGMAVVAMGLVAGCLLALAFGRWLQSVLYGVEASDPRMFAATTLLLALVALAACALPAARASRVDPLVALRQD